MAIQMTWPVYCLITPTVFINVRHKWPSAYIPTCLLDTVSKVTCLSVSDLYPRNCNQSDLSTCHRVCFSTNPNATSRNVFVYWCDSFLGMRYLRLPSSTMLSKMYSQGAWLRFEPEIYIWGRLANKWPMSPPNELRYTPSNYATRKDANNS
jgi:hypothetical protein